MKTLIVVKDPYEIKTYAKLSKVQTKSWESTIAFILLSDNKYRLLKKLILSSAIVQAKEIPQEYDGNCVYELLPTKQE